MINKQKPSAVYREVEDRQNKGLASLLWMIAGVLIAAAIAAAVYFSPLFDGYRSSINIEEEAPVAPLNTQAQSAPAPNYEFYEVLPKQDFRSIPEGVSVQESDDGASRTLSADAVVETSAKAQKEAQIELVEEDATYDGDSAQENSEVQSGVTYILQIKSYSDAAEADEKRANVMLSGVDAVVLRRVDKATGASFYQVVSTPMSSRQEASDALLKLRNNGIDALMVEQRHKAP